MRNRGFTLIELLVVIAVFGILVVALSFAFIGWQGRYKVESQIKDIYADLMDARVRAMRVNRIHFISLVNDTEYTMHDDTSDGSAKVPDGDGTLQMQTAGPVDTQDTRLGSFPKTVEFDIRWSYSALVPIQDIAFNERGLATTTGNISIFIDRDSDGNKDFVPDYDCIVIAATRINLGQLNAVGNNCNAK